MYDYRGIDGTGTRSNPASGSNQVSYVIRKLADGNCWMSENLKLTLSTSHAYEVATFSGGTASWTPNSTTTSSAYNYAITPNTQVNISVNGKNEWYYPWYAATAGQGTRTASPTISQSICPKSWKLPNGGTNAAPSFQSLATAYSIGVDSAGSTKLQGVPLSFYYAGDYYSGSLSDTSHGYYWSASPYTSNSDRAYVLYVGSSYGNPQDNSYKFRGFSVRCVAIP
ncbi:hypothetical protein IJG78_00545 [Candidatus Saccharibacteria bacterium]|nr:hypothetical protein [Candidatus Saccharibacteria bacterium]